MLLTGEMNGFAEIGERFRAPGGPSMLSSFLHHAAGAPVII